MNSIMINEYKVTVDPFDDDQIGCVERMIDSWARHYGCDPEAARRTTEEVLVSRREEFLRNAVWMTFFGEGHTLEPTAPAGLIGNPSSFRLIEIPFHIGKRQPKQYAPFWFPGTVFACKLWMSFGADPARGHAGIPGQFFEYWREFVFSVVWANTEISEPVHRKASWKEIGDICRREDEAVLSEGSLFVHSLPTENLGIHLPPKERAEFSKHTGVAFTATGSVLRKRVLPLVMPKLLKKDEDAEPLIERLTNRLLTLAKASDRIICELCLDDPATLKDDDIITDRDVRRMRAHLRAVDAVGTMLSELCDSALASEMRRVFEGASLIRAACAAKG